MKPVKPTTPLFAVTAIALAVLAAPALSWAWSLAPPPVVHPLVVLFFFALGLFTIVTGFPHRYYGHVSFDRSAQYAALLIFGPVFAAAVNSICSLVYPFSRLRQGKPLREVLESALANAGMMCLVILASGGVYLLLGGRVPLNGLQLGDLKPLLAMALTAQLLNELIIAWFVWARGGDVRGLFSPFEYAVEFSSVLIAIVLALAWNGLDRASFVLIMLLTAVGMRMLHHFALLRISLERTVANRTAELQEKSAALENLANEDALTGLPNRRQADARLSAEVQRALRYRRPLSIALGDIDHFKAVNDRHAHAVGDAVLAQLGELLPAQLREADLVSRFGGEEFLLLLPETGITEAAQLCERLRRGVAGHDWEAIAPGLSLTISFGVAAMVPGDDRSSLLARADHALYAAKHAGRDRVVTSAKGPALQEAH